jgi:hypothetical protein
VEAWAIDTDNAAFATAELSRVSAADMQRALSLSVRSGRAIRVCDVIATDGVELVLRDVSETRIPRTVSGESGRVFTSDHEVLSAGLDFSVRVVGIDPESSLCRLLGSLAVSAFGAGDPLSRTTRSLNFDLDLTLGSFVRVGRLRASARGGSFSADASAAAFDLFASADASEREWSIWLGVSTP